MTCRSEQAALFSDDDVVAVLTPPPARGRRSDRAPRHLVLMVERWAHSAKVCLPELIELATNGRTCVATDLTREEALKLEGELREIVREREAETAWLHTCRACRRVKDRDASICDRCMAKLPPEMVEAFAEMSSPLERSRWERDALLMLKSKPSAEGRHVDRITA